MWPFTSVSSQEITETSDVYIALSRLSNKVNEIRLEMGVVKHGITPIDVSNAQPREVYFQAQTVMEKISRLHFDLLRDRPQSPKVATTDATPADVMALVQQAEILMTSIYQHLDIEAQEPKIDLGTSLNKTPTDVYILMIDVSRTLNEMIEQRFSPAEAFQQVTYAISIASSILIEQGVGQAMGDTSVVFVPRKTPTDVYEALIKINNNVHEVIKAYNGNCLKLGDQETQRNRVAPGDVYDLASLVVAELNYLRNLVNATTEPHAPYYPGKKLPAHVHQRVEQLSSQIALMLERTTP